MVVRLIAELVGAFLACLGIDFGSVDFAQFGASWVYEIVGEGDVDVDRRRIAGFDFDVEVLEDGFG